MTNIKNRNFSLKKGEITLCKRNFYALRTGQFIEKFKQKCEYILFQGKINPELLFKQPIIFAQDEEI